MASHMAFLDVHASFASIVSVCARPEHSTELVKRVVTMSHILLSQDSLCRT